jgi:hypothetical protein
VGEAQLREWARHPGVACASNLNDPRRIPYLLVWKDESHDSKIKEAVRLAHFIACGDVSYDYVKLKRTHGDATVLRIVWRTLPRNGGRALFLLCPHCDTPRRHVYDWEWNWSSGRSNEVCIVSWRCRSCARLRYSSEGGYLQPRRLFRAFENLPRPASWFPCVFTDPDDAIRWLREPSPR